jgi:hypothetical protein
VHLNRWASDLVRRLTNAGHAVTLLNGPQVSRPSLIAALPSADCVIFFGHGEHDLLWAQPTGWFVIETHVFLDDQTASALQGKPLYAVCCRALRTFGVACGNCSPSSVFIGYQGPFGLSSVAPYFQQFQDVVNQSALAFVNGMPASTIVQILQSEWRTLADSYLNGTSPPSYGSNAWVAGYGASVNALFVGHAP